LNGKETYILSSAGTARRRARRDARAIMGVEMSLAFLPYQPWRDASTKERTASVTPFLPQSWNYERRLGYQRGGNNL